MGIGAQGEAGAVYGFQDLLVSVPKRIWVVVLGLFPESWLSVDLVPQLDLALLGVAFIPGHIHLLAVGDGFLQHLLDLRLGLAQHALDPRDRVIGRCVETLPPTVFPLADAVLTVGSFSWHILKYIFKTYIADGVERQVYREVCSDTSAISSQSVSFPDSLVSLVEMDVGTKESTIWQLNNTLWQRTLTQDKQYQERAPALLDADNGTEAVPRRMVAYYRTVGDKAFRFYPQLVGFE